MSDTKQNISNAFGTDTTKLKTWELAIKDTIAQDGNKLLDKNQITVKLDKWEKELSEKRASNA